MSDDEPMYDQAMSAIRNRDEKIERLEAKLAECQNLLSLNARPVDMAKELADLRRNREGLIECLDRAKADRDRARLAYETAEASHRIEIEHLRASSVVYKVRCETCGGSGGRSGSYNVASYWRPGKCPDCDNGWRLAEGVRKITPAVKVYDKIIGDYVFPARLIEGDT